MKAWLVLLASLVPSASLLAHHSIISFDITKPVRVKGTIVRFHRINPHSFIVLDQTGTDERKRWAVEGPSALQLDRRGIAAEALKPGDVVEVCGYLPKENVVRQIDRPDADASSLSGLLLNAELLVTPDGREQSWGDYGVHLCFPPGHRDQHSR